MDDQAVGPELVLSTAREGDTATVTVRGELDAYSAPGLEDQVARLGDQGVVNIVLDLSPTGFLDSSGLRAMLTVQRRLQDRGGRLTLRTPSEPVARLLEITGLTDHFAVS